jgi:hypothetical protein
MHSLIFRLFLAVVATSATTSVHALPGDFVEGRVLEEGTNTPLADVIVTIVWIGRAGSDNACLHSATAYTDSSGRYQVMQWRHPARMGRFREIAPTAIAYLPGYEQRSRDSLETVRLRRDDSSRDVRLQKLHRWRADAECAISTGGKRIPSPLPAALLEEAESLVDERSNAEAIEPFRFEAEKQRFGEVTATHRQEQRRQRAK